MVTKFSKATSKGQITLPSKWRNRFKTSDFVMEIYDDQVVVKPILKDEVIFDCEIDNEGSGIPIDDMIEMLNKIKNGQA